MCYKLTTEHAQTTVYEYFFLLLIIIFKNERAGEEFSYSYRKLFNKLMQNLLQK